MFLNKLFKICMKKIVSPENKVRLKRKLKRYTPMFFSGRYFFSREKGADLIDTTNKVDAVYGKLAHSGLFTLDMPLIVINPYRLAPLTAMFLFATEEECEVEVVTAGMQGGRDFVSYEEAGRFHRVPVFGLYPGCENGITLFLKQKGNIMEKRYFQIPIGEMPEEIKCVAEVKLRESDSAFPFKLIVGGDMPYPCAVDETGTVRYYLKKRARSYGLIPLSGGRMWFMEKNNQMIAAPSFSNPVGTRIYEIDWWGRIWNIYQLRFGIHHDVCEKEPGGNIIAASASLEKYTEDAVIEIDRHTGKLVKMVKFEELLPGVTYCDNIDWAHINSVQYLADQDAVLACARNLHSVFLIDWRRGKLNWIFGSETFWNGTGFEKYLIPAPREGNFYQPHAAERIGENLLLLYDNHTNKRHPVADFDGDTKSYVRMFRLDIEKRKAELLHSYASKKSSIRSNGIFCETEGRVFVMSGYLSRKIAENQGAVYEYDSSGRLLNHMETVYSFYRAYAFSPDMSVLGKKLPEESRWLCEFEKVRRVDRGEIFSARTLPGNSVKKSLPNKMEQKETPRTRKEERAKKWMEIDSEELLRTIRIRRETKCLVVSGYDHSIQAIYLAGDDGVFKVDYSGTEQTLPEYFGRSYYGMPFDFQQLSAGRYVVYIRSGKKVYNTGFVVKV